VAAGETNRGIHRGGKRCVLRLKIPASGKLEKSRQKYQKIEGETRERLVPRGGESKISGREKGDSSAASSWGERKGGKGRVKVSSRTKKEKGTNPKKAKHINRDKLVRRWNARSDFCAIPEEHWSTWKSLPRKGKGLIQWGSVVRPRETAKERAGLRQPFNQGKKSKSGEVTTAHREGLGKGFGANRKMKKKAKFVRRNEGLKESGATLKSASAYFGPATGSAPRN